ncbi:MAG: hypothetical protein ACRD5H_10155 [Nitrososphaerales archaeon]
MNRKWLSHVLTAILLTSLVMVQNISAEESTSNNSETNQAIIQYEPIIWINKEAYSIGDKILINVQDRKANMDAAKVENVDIRAVSRTDRTGILIKLIEDATDTGKFSGVLLLSAEGPSHDSVLKVSLGDLITVSYNNPPVTATAYVMESTTSQYEYAYVGLILLGIVVFLVWFGKSRTFYLRRSVNNHRSKR